MDANNLEALRHSASHVMAQAVQQLFPEMMLGIGPAIEHGFYYDFDGPHHFVPEDLPRIEAKMREIAKARHPFRKSEHPRAEAIEYFESRGEKYKVELINDLPDAVVSYFTHSDFTDLCKGPHVGHTGKIGHFKLTRLAGAYWRGDEGRPMLQRIYGVAFDTKEALEAHLAMLEEAKKRDHRKLGRELGIYFFDDDVGPGLPLWLPRGAVIIEELESLAKKTEAEAGYVRVRTPHICKESLYLTSGHLPYYKDSMYPPMELEGEKYYLKPMNCPHHHKIFGSSLRSYRDLPLRLAEYGTCYRYEQSGELFGLMRVRSMQMNDAHIYWTLDQFQTEFLAVCRMYLGYFKIFGIEKYLMRFSTHAAEGLGKKYVDEPELWTKTEDLVERALVAGEVPYAKAPNEAAFYGPKIDVQVWSAIGREFSLATNQVDFAQPRRFGLVYHTAEHGEETPLCIHRAPLGTHERFIGFLIEHFAGALPLWLSPVQVRVLTITDGQNAPAKGLSARLAAAGLRAEVDDASHKIGYKIRDAQVDKVPYMVVLGPKDVESKTLAVRLRDGRQFNGVTEADFLAKVLAEKESKSLKPAW
ncbi:MAG: threonine--tRNA ligase [Elusimicrobia bacterium]|nr:threonine--tRNA ligase [Elusimicrobiota bacterium]